MVIGQIFEGGDREHLALPGRTAKKWSRLEVGARILAGYIGSRGGTTSDCHIQLGGETRKRENFGKDKGRTATSQSRRKTIGKAKGLERQRPQKKVGLPFKVAKSKSFGLRIMEKYGGIYLRVSGDDQNPENQIADVKKLAEALRYKVVEVYVDKDSGGYSDRKEFQRMMTDAEAGKFQTLFIWALDRFSREGIKATLTHIEKLKEIGVALKSYQESWLDTANEGIWQLLVAVLSWAAKEELKRFRERSMAGKKTRLANNKLIGCYPPYGYSHIKRDREKGTDASFVVNESEAAVVRKIFKLYLEFESIFLVAKRLMKDGIKARGKGRQEPGFFQCSTISKILRREDYIGNHYHGKSSPCVAKFHIHKTRKHRLTGRKMNPRQEWKVIKVPAIVDKEIFYKVQELLKKRAKYRLFKSKYEFLCQGLIRCVRCHRSYGGRMQGKYPLYRCSQAYNSNFNMPTCRARSIGQRKIDNIVWLYVSGLINDKEKIIKNVRILQRRRKEQELSNQKIYDNLLSEKKGIKMKKSRLLELCSDGKVQKEDLESKISELNDRENMLDGQISEIKRGMENTENLDGTEKEIEKICALYRKKIENPPFELKRYIVRKWIEEINIEDDGSIRIKVRMPRGEEDKITPSNGFSTTNNIDVKALNFELKFEEIIPSVR